MRIVTLASFSRSASRVRPTVKALTPRISIRAVSQANPVGQRGFSNAGCDVATSNLTTSTRKRNTNSEMAPAKLELKTPKGTRDWGGEGIILREQIFDTSRLLPSPRPRRVRASLRGTAFRCRASCDHRRAASASGLRTQLLHAAAADKGLAQSRPFSNATAPSRSTPPSSSARTS